MSMFRSLMMVQPRKEYYVKNGLILWYDGILKSNNINVWEDLSGSNNHATLYNATKGEDCIQFNGTSTYGTFANLPASDITMEVLVKFNSLVGYQPTIVDITNSYTICGNREYSMLTSLSSAADKNYVFTYRGTNVGIKNLISVVNGRLPRVNNVLKSDRREARLIGCNYSSIGAQVGTTIQGFLNADIYCIRVYNRQLTDEERTFNYNIDKERFGI
jgi:hypothetical protein